MNQLTVPVLTMSSRDIAELTGKEHKHVLRDCLTMFDELGLDISIQKQSKSPEYNRSTRKQYKYVKPEILGEINQHFGSDLSVNKNNKIHGITCIYDDCGHVVECIMNYDHTMCLITGSSAPLRMIVIKRWRELEQQLNPAFSLPQDLPSVLRALADTHEQLQQTQNDTQNVNLSALFGGL